MKKYSAQFAIASVLAVVAIFVSAPGVKAQEAFTATSGNNPGEVTLTWKKSVGDATNYHVVYGPENSKSQFSALNIDGGVATGKSISYTVRFLNPNAKYFFALSVVKNKVALPAGIAISAVSKGGVVKLPEVSQGQAPAPAGTLTTLEANDKIASQNKSSIKSNGVGLHQLSVKKAASGEVILSWKKVYKDVNNYDIVYGTEPGKLQYGAQNLGDITSFAVKSLDPKKQYYFALVPKKGKEAQYITQQASTTNAAPAPHEEIKQAAGQPSMSTTTTQSGTGGTTTTTTTTSGGTTGATNTTTTGTGGTTTGTTNTTNTTNTTTTTTPTTNTTTTTTNTTTTTKGKDKKVKGAQTELNLWQFVRSLFSF